MKRLAVWVVLSSVLAACTQTPHANLPACHSKIPELADTPRAPSAPQREYAGEVLLALTVENSGSVSSVTPVRIALKPVAPVTGSASREVANLLAAARHWRFRPQSERCMSLRSVVLM
jgi:hypothetical protein